MRLTHRTIDALRHKVGSAISLVITDRCPPGCSCGAAAPSIDDLELYERVLDGLVAQTEIELVTLIGGEPFVERHGLTLATRRLSAAGKLIAVVTSASWATKPQISGWVHDVLTRCDCVIVRTDGPHVVSVDEPSLIRAVREITASEAWVVLQVTDEPGARERAATLLNHAFGGRWDQHAEIQLGPRVANPESRQEAQQFGPCMLLRSPTLRYDGVLGACNNEQVGRGLGPARLRRSAETSDAIRHGLQAVRRDPLLRIIGDAGLGTLIRHPELRALGDQRFGDPCELCWKALARLPIPNDLAIAALANDLEETKP
jgi:hypothetical protein